MLNNDNPPIVSVVLPTYNRSKLISRSIRSVLAQTFAEFELIVVDDNSSDDTESVIAEFLSDARVRYVRNASNAGPSGARNIGISHARGHYIAFQDSDDRWLPEKLERQMSAMAARPDCRASFCGAIYFSQEQCYYIPRDELVDRAVLESGDIACEILFENLVTPQTLIAERSLFEEAGPFDETLPIKVDWDLGIRLAQAGKFAFVNDPLVLIYRTVDSVSNNRAADGRTRARIVEKYRAAFEAQPAALARQLYVIGCIHIDNRHIGEALSSLAQSFKARPNLRTAAQFARASFFYPFIGSRTASPRRAAL